MSVWRERNLSEIFLQLRIFFLTYMLYLHQPGIVEGKGAFNVAEFLKHWRQLEGAVRRGEVGSIGLSDMTKEKLEALLPHCQIPPAVLYVCSTQGLLCVLVL